MITGLTNYALGTDGCPPKKNLTYKKPNVVSKDIKINKSIWHSSAEDINPKYVGPILIPVIQCELRCIGPKIIFSTGL